MNRDQRRRCLLASPLIWGLCVLSGCTTPATPMVAVEQHKPGCANDVCTLLGYLKSIKSWSAVDLTKELEMARKSYAGDKSEFNRMQLALLLTVAATGPNDRRLAVQLLDTAILDPNSSPELVALARLLRIDLQDRLRLDDNLRQHMQKAREAQLRMEDADKRKSEAQSRNEELERKIREEQNRVSEIEMKLDTLKDIERRLLEQDKGAARP